MCRAQENGRSLTLRAAFVAFLGKLGHALHIEGHTALNFRPLVWRLFRAMEDDDFTWLHDLPSRYPRQEADIMRTNAARMAKYVTDSGLAINDYPALTGTLGFEELNELVLRLGNGDFGAGWQAMTNAIRAVPRGSCIDRWSDLQLAAKAAAAAQSAAPSAATTAKPQTSSRIEKEFIRRQVEELLRLQPVAEIAKRLFGVAERRGHRFDEWNPFRCDLPHNYRRTLSLEKVLLKLGDGDLARGSDALEKFIEAKRLTARVVHSLDDFLPKRTKTTKGTASEETATK